MNGGIHREDQIAEERGNACLDGVNVVEDDGDLRRRDAFHAIAAGAPFLLPAGSTMLIHSSSVSYRYNRLPIFLSGGAGCDIGAFDPFDGVRWGNVVTWPIAPAQHQKLQVSYWNGTTWVIFAEVVDTTVRRITDSNGDVWLRPLTQTGEVHWHRSQATNWVTGHPLGAEGASRYWVRFEALTYFNGIAPVATAFGISDGIALTAPGVRAFLRGPARSVIPVTISGTPKLIVGSDRQPRGLEGGAQLGIRYEHDRPTKEVHLIGGQILQADEAAGSLGQAINPGTFRGALGQAWPSGTWTTLTAAGIIGTANTLVRNQRSDVTYNWLVDQFRGSPVFQNLQLTSISQDTIRLFGLGSVTLSAKQQECLPDAGNMWEGYRLICTVNGSGTGTPVGEEREIVRATYLSASTAQVRWHDHFSITPNSQNRFDIVRPHCSIEFSPPGVERDRRYEILNNTTVNVTMVPGSVRPFATDFTGELNRFVHFQIGRPLHLENRSGDFWDATFDTTTRTALVTNGQNVPYQFDGRSMRRLRALSDPNNARVQLWVGSMPDNVKNELRAFEIAGSKLRQTPPVGRFITTWFGHTVLAGLRGRPYDIAYSAPAPNNDIWPLLYQTQIRDPFNLPITGMKALRDRLAVFTAASIHGLFPPNDDGLLQLEPIAMGVGFVSQRAVTHIGMDTLIGAASDGVYMLSGSDITPVLSEWEHLVEGGANRANLYRAVAAFSFQRNEFYLAFPGRGSLVCDKIAVYNVTKQRWWLWEAPWGGVADIAVQRLSDGTEKLLFGMEDGTIAVLRKGATDDGDVITGRARSPLHQVDTKNYRLEQLNLYAKEQSSLESLTVRHLIDTTRTAFASPSQSVKLSAAGPSRLDNGTLSTTFALAYDRWVSKPFLIKEGAEASAYAYEVEGTSQWRIRMAELVTTGPVVQPSKK